MQRKLIQILLISIFFVSCEITKILDPATTIYRIVSFNLDGKSWVPGAHRNTTDTSDMPNLEGLVKNNNISIFAHRRSTPLFNHLKLAMKNLLFI